MAISARMAAANARQGISSPSSSSSSSSSGSGGASNSSSGLSTNGASNNYYKDAPGYIAGSSTSDSTSSQAAFRAGGGTPSTFGNTPNTSIISGKEMTTPGAPQVPILQQNPNNLNYGSYLPGTLEQQQQDLYKESDNNALQTISGLMNTEKESSASLYNKAMQQSGKEQAQRVKNDLSAQINSITANAQAQKLSLVGQGRGITEGVIGGQQGQIDREAAIRALPLTAQLQAAQDNLTAATETMNNLFKIYSDDAQNTYGHKVKVLEFAANYTDKQTQRKLDDVNKGLDRQYAEQQQARDSNNAIALELAKNGKGTASMYNALAKATTVAEGIKIAGSALYTPTTDIVKLDNGTTLLIDKLTGKTIKNLGGSSAATDNNFHMTKDSLDTLHDGNIVATIANTIKSSGAKQSQQTNDAINVIAGLQSLVDNNPDGQFAGVGPIHARDFFSGEKEIGTRASLEAINLKVQQWASGAALTEAQTAQVKKMTPDAYDTDKQVRSKTNELANYMISQVSGQLAGQGVGFSMDKVDMFNRKPLDTDPLKVNVAPTANGQDSLGIFK